MKARTRALTVAAAAVAALTAACDGSGADDDRSDAVDDAVVNELVVLVNETARLEAEVLAAESRLTRACMADRGFHVHDEQALAAPEPPPPHEGITDAYPFDQFLPHPEAAAEWGFGAWANTAEAFGTEDAEAYYRHLTAQSPTTAPVDNSAFMALSPAERREWYAAFVGEAGADAMMAMADGVESVDASSGGAALEAPVGESGDGGSTDGCRQWTWEELYGEPVLVAESAEDGSEGYLSYRPAPPAADADFTRMQAEAHAEVLDTADAFTACVEDAGHGTWGFNEFATIPAGVYWQRIYEPDSGLTYVSEWTSGLPDPPAGLPEDFAALKDLEIRMAEDFAACGERSGYRAAAAAAWEQRLGEYYASIESDLYAWQESMNDTLATAQQLLAE